MRFQFGLLAFSALTTREWLLHAISQRRRRQESAQSLVRLKLALYCVVFPLLFLTMLIVVVLVAF